MAWVYIIKSVSTGKFYVGFTTESPEERMSRHNSNYYEDKFTAGGKPWELFWVLKCNTSVQARAIESHIKKMKSRSYIQNLKNYPEIGQKLFLKYS